MQIKLPVSGYTLDLRETCTYGEFKTLENFQTDNLKAKVSKGGEYEAEIEGSLIGRHKDKIIQTFLSSCRGKDNQEISILGLMDTLDVEDGFIVSEKVADIYEAIKKKLGKTGKK